MPRTRLLLASAQRECCLVKSCLRVNDGAFKSLVPSWLQLPAAQQLQHQHDRSMLLPATQLDAETVCAALCELPCAEGG
jgi:hypothetical protein